MVPKKIRSTRSAPHRNQILARPLNSGVLCLGLKQHQILNPVVRAISVNVVDYLVREQLPSKVLLHNVPIVVHAFPINFFDSSALPTGCFLVHGLNTTKTKVKVKERVV